MTPKHVAIIMDGNGRWAQKRGYPRFYGHIRGCRVVSDIVETAAETGVRCLTLYAFSTENWRRPESEITVLFKLFRKFLKKEERKMLRNGIRLRFIGDLSALPEKVQETAYSVMERTSGGKKMDLVLAVNYGAKAEIIRAVNLLKDQEEISESDIDSHLWNSQFPQVDLLLRTGGDQRISNFLLWQAAYAELFFVSKYWPDFERKDFLKILDQFAGRERRFGDVVGHSPSEVSLA